VNKINFFKEDVRFRLQNKEQLIKWLRAAVKQSKFQLEEINFIFCTDQYLLALNKKFLNHHFFTDIITFDQSTEKGKLSGDLFISFDRVKENAKLYDVSFRDELHRVMIHGVLHLLGYTDKNKADQKLMRKKEDEWLVKRKF
jgi:probable rRNA maturation factor